MYCNIVFMIDIFVISKITQYRYYVIAITDVRSLGLSTKWRTLMIKKTMKVRENTFRKLEDPFENGAAKKYVFYVKVDDVAEGIPMATNPRDQKLTSGVATAIKESLLSNDGCHNMKKKNYKVRVRFINEDEKQLSMTDDRIEKAIRQNSVRLMIMDPIQAYLGANVDMNRANEIRPLFRHLSTIAERTGCAIVLIGHLNKSSGSQSDYRSLGSIDIAAAVRSILFVEKVEKEKEQDIRVVYQQKDSLAKKENPVAFSLGEEGLKWLGEYDISIEDLLMGKAGTKKETKLEKAQKLILELLTKRKVMCLEELEAELLAYGISSRTGRDARKQLENRLSYDWCQGRKTVALITE